MGKYQFNPEDLQQPTGEAVSNREYQFNPVDTQRSSEAVGILVPTDPPANPEQDAEVAGLAKFHGVPKEIVANDLEHWRGVRKAKEGMDLAEALPHLAGEFAKIDYNGKIARGEIGALQRVGNLFSMVSDQALRTYYQFERGNLVARAAREGWALKADPSKGISSPVEADIARIDRFIDGIDEDPSTGGGTYGYDGVGGKILSTATNVLTGMTVPWMVKAVGTLALPYKNRNVETLSTKHALNEAIVELGHAFTENNPWGSFINQSTADLYEGMLSKGVPIEDARRRAVVLGAIIGAADASTAVLTTVMPVARGATLLGASVAGRAGATGIAGGLTRLGGALGQSAAKAGAEGLLKTTTGYVGGALVEAAQEVGQDAATIGSIAYAEARSKGYDYEQALGYTLDVMTDKSKLEQYRETGLYTTLSMLLIGAPGAAGSVAARTSERTAAEKQAQSMDRLIQYAKDSPAIKGDTAAAENFIEKATTGTNAESVSINLEAFENHAKNTVGVTPEVLAKQLGVEPQYALAQLEGNGDIHIRAAKFATVLAAPGHADKMRNDLRFSDGEMTVNETADATAETIAEIQLEAARAVVDTTEVEGAEPMQAMSVAEDTSAKLAESPEAQAAFLERVFPIMAKKKGELETSLPEAATLDDKQLNEKLLEATGKDFAYWTSQEEFKQRTAQIADTEAVAEQMRQEGVARYEEARKKRLEEFGQRSEALQGISMDEIIAGWRKLAKPKQTMPSTRDAAGHVAAQEVSNLAGNPKIVTPQMTEVQRKARELFLTAGMDPVLADQLATLHSKLMDFTADLVGASPMQMWERWNLQVNAVTPQEIGRQYEAHGIKVVTRLMRQAIGGTPLNEREQNSLTQGLENIRLGRAVQAGTEAIHGSHIRKAVGNKIASIYTRIIGSDVAEGIIAVHELNGHAFLSLLEELEREFPNSAKLKNYNRIVLQELGVTRWSQVTGDHHETFSRWQERYFQRGIAPTPELATVFSKMKQFFLILGDALTDLRARLLNRTNNPVPEQLRASTLAMLDRMYSFTPGAAVSEDVDLTGLENEVTIPPSAPQAMAVSLGVDPNLAATKQLPTTPEGQKEYKALIDKEINSAIDRLAKTVESPEFKRRKFEWEQAHESLVEEHLQKLNADKNSLTLHRLMDNALPDGTPFAGQLPSVKLNREQVLKEFGKDAVAILDGKGKRVITKKGGMKLEQAFVQFGYSSKEELVNALLGTEPAKKVAEREATNQMLKDYGPPITEKMISEEVIDSIINTEREKRLQFEIEHIILQERVTAAGAQPALIMRSPDIKTIRAQVQSAVNGTRVDDLKPSRALRVAAKNSKAAKENIHLGKRPEAVSNLVGELVATVHYTASKNALVRADKALRFAKKLGKLPAQKRLGLAGGGIQETVNYIRSLIGAGEELTGDEQGGVMTLSEVKARMMNEVGQDIDIPAEFDEMYSEGPSAVQLGNLTYGQLEAAYRVLRQLSQAASIATEVVLENRQLIAEDAVNDIVSEITQTHEVEEKKVPGEPEKKARFKKLLQSMVAWHSRMEFLFQYLDNFKELGPTWRNLFKPAAEAQDAESKMGEDYMNRLNKIWERYSPEERRDMQKKTILVPSTGEMLSKFSAIMVGLNMGTVYNRNALIGGERGWNAGDVQEIVNTLDKRDLETIQSIHDLYDTLWEPSRDLYRKLHGVSAEKVEASPWSNKNGVVRGGYHPVAFDERAAPPQMELSEADEVSDAFGGAYYSAMAKVSSQKERTDTGGRAVSLDPNVISNHVIGVIHDITHREMVFNAWRIIKNPKFRAAVQAATDEATYDQLKPWLMRMAKAPLKSDDGPIGKIFDTLRHGFTAKTLGAAAATGVLQVTGFATSVVEIGPVWVAKGLADVQRRGPRAALEFVYSQSEEMRRRIKGGYDLEIRDALKKLGVLEASGEAAVKIPGMSKKMAASFLQFIGVMQMMVDLPTWLGAYQKAMDGSVPGVGPSDAAAYADSVVRTTQGAQGAKDVARIQAGGPLLRTWVMFFSYGSLLGNRLQKEYRLLKLTRNPARFGAAMAVYFAPEVIGMALRGDVGEDDDPEEVAKKLAKAAARFPFSTMVGARDVFDVLVPLGKGKPGDVRNPAIAAATEVAYAAKVPAEYLLTELGLMDENITKAELRKAIGGVGILTHLPTNQIWKTGHALYDINENGGRSWLQDVADVTTRGRK